MLLLYTVPYPVPVYHQYCCTVCSAEALFLLCYHHALYVAVYADKEYGFLHPVSKQAQIVLIRLFVQSSL